jgi:hypothetical protein
MLDDAGPANIKGSALSTIAGAAHPDEGALPLDKVLPPRKSNRGGSRPGAGRKSKARGSTRAAPEGAPAATEPDEVDPAEAERVNNAVALNRCVDMLLVGLLGEEMKAADKELAQLDAALVEYQKIKGTVPVPIELVLVAAYSQVYGKKLMQPTPKQRIYLAWLKLRGAVAAVFNRFRRRK